MVTEGLERSDQESLNSTLHLVKVCHSNETYFLSSKNFDSRDKGEYIIIEVYFGVVLAQDLGPIKNGDSNDQENVRFLRKATDADVAKFRANLPKERDAFLLCKEKIDQHRLEMKLTSVHFLPEEPKIIFFFTANERIDFRELVKDLVSVFHQRIELRQIGVRDESRILGGRGICGRQLCCAGVSDRLQPVSIKMAKVQNLSLNSMKISGHCGRLLCCLAYEFDVYQNEHRKLPRLGYRFSIDNDCYILHEINILNKTVLLKGQNSTFKSFPLCKLKFNPEKKQWIVNDCDCNHCEAGENLASSEY